ncbi:MAG: hypothetical protein ACLP0B_24165, partial [Steroidobacteraceae bacterium]
MRQFSALNAAPRPFSEVQNRICHLFELVSRLLRFLRVNSTAVEITAGVIPMTDATLKSLMLT